MQTLYSRTQDTARAAARYRPQSRASGFSLLEIMCALVVLAVGIVGIMEAMTLALRSNKAAEHDTIAAQLAAGQIELLRADGYITEEEDEGTFDGAFAKYSWKKSVTETQQRGLYRVKVEVFPESTPQDAYVLETLLFEVPFETTVTPRERRRQRMMNRPRGVGGRL